LPIEELINRAANILGSARHAVVLTGAGISTESGIPDFRSPGTGLWENEDPEDFTIESFNSDPQRFYRRIMPLLRVINGAVPNNGHLALAEMERRGFVQAVITQNIDNLHQEAGSKNVLEVHGSITAGTCLSCGSKNKLHEFVDEPACSSCGGVIKPDITLFGEDLPPAFQRAQREAMRCDCMLVVGSSLQVAPAGYLPRYSKNLLIINRGTTPYDEMARVVIRSPAGEVLTGILDALDVYR
jgi:NAD-dependent deacetylase